MMNQMRYRRFGKTEIKVSQLGMDCHSFGSRQLDSGWDPYTYEGRIFAARTVHAALDVGINYFVTSADDGNGYAESLLGKALQKRRHDVILSSRILTGDESPSEVLERVVACLRRLRTNYIDIVQIGRDNGVGRGRKLDDIVDTLIRLRDKGVLGHIGLTTTKPRACSDVIGMAQLQYDVADNGLARNVLNWCGHQDFGVSVLQPRCGPAIQQEAPKLGDNWSLMDDSDDFRLKFMLTDRRIHSISVGMRWEHEVHLNAALVSASHPYAAKPEAAESAEAGAAEPEGPYARNQDALPVGITA